MCIAHFAVARRLPVVLEAPSIARARQAVGTGRARKTAIAPGKARVARAVAIGLTEALGGAVACAEHKTVACEAGEARVALADPVVALTSVGAGAGAQLGQGIDARAVIAHPSLVTLALPAVAVAVSGAVVGAAGCLSHNTAVSPSESSVACAVSGLACAMSAAV